MHEPPLAKSLIDAPEEYTLTLQVGRRMVHVLATAPGRPSVVSAIQADITAPNMAVALREVVYANPMLLLPYGKVMVLIDAREYYWLPTELEAAADDVSQIMGYDSDRERQWIIVPVDGQNAIAMRVESALINFVHRTFPEGKVSLPAAEMVRYLNGHPSGSSSGRVHVDVGAESMTVAVFDSAGLGLCGTYHPTGVESQTYYAVAATNTAGVNVADAEMFVSGSSDTRAALIASLSRFSHHVMAAVVPAGSLLSSVDAYSIPYPLVLSCLCE